MKEKKLLWLMALLLVVCVFSLPLTTYAADPTRTPPGPVPAGPIKPIPTGVAVITVTDGTNPISGATVSATGGSAALTATTDGNGKATFSRLLPATYSFTATKATYTGATANVTITAGTTATATISLKSPTISITNPQRFDVLYPGLTYPITWTYTGDPGPLDIYVVNIYGNQGLIASNVPCNGRYDWTVDSNAISADFSLRIVSRANSAITASSETFGIRHPSITVTQPTGGATFTAGTAVPIGWTFAGNIGSKVRIKVTSVAGNAPVLDVETASGTVYNTKTLTGSGSYNGWKAPLSETAQQYVFRVESVQNPSLFGQSFQPITVPAEHQLVSAEAVFIAVNGPKASDMKISVAVTNLVMFGATIASVNNALGGTEIPVNGSAIVPLAVVSHPDGSAWKKSELPKIWCRISAVPGSSNDPWRFIAAVNLHFSDGSKISQVSTNPQEIGPSNGWTVNIVGPVLIN